MAVADDIDNLVDAPYFLDTPLNGFLEALQAINAGDKDILHSPVLQFQQDGEP